MNSANVFKPLICASENMSNNPYPVEGFPSWARKMILQASESYAVPVEMIATAVLGCISTALQGKYEVFPKRDHREQLTLQMIIAASSGSLKSEVLATAFAPAYAYERSLVEKEADLERIRTAQRREKELYIKRLKGKFYRANDDIESERILNEIQILCDELDSLSRVPRPAVIIDDATPEAIIKKMYENGGRIGIASAEGNLFAILNGKYSRTTDYTPLVKGFSGDRISVDRIGRQSETIEHAHVSMVICVQPHILTNLTTTTFLDEQGVLARICYVADHNSGFNGSGRYGEHSIDSGTIEEYNRAMIALFETIVPDTPQHLFFTDSAFAEYSKIHDNISEKRRGIYGSMERWLAKYPGLISRIAGILHICNDPTSLEINESELQHAMQIAAWYEKEAANVLDPSAKTSQLALAAWNRIMAMYGVNGQQEIPYADALHSCFRVRPFMTESNRYEDSLISKVITSLEQHGYLVIKSNGNMLGRQGRTIVLSDDAIAYSQAERQSY